METNNNLENTQQLPITPPTSPKKSFKLLIIFGPVLVFGIILLIGYSLWIYYMNLKQKPSVDKNTIYITPISSNPYDLPTMYNFKESNNKKVVVQALFSIHTIKIPYGWYVTDTKNNEITFGAGIQSYLTVRKKTGSNVLNDRISEYKSSGYNVSEQEVTINNKKYTQLLILKGCQEDVCYVPIVEWIVPQEENTLIFSNKIEDTEQIAKILSTIEDSGNDCNLTLYLASGCGRCPNVTPEQKCVYHSKGDNLCLIAAQDLELSKNTEYCSTVGCSRGINYTYCD